MSISYVCPWGRGNCYQGKIDGYFVHAQVFDHLSPEGIAEGKISQLYLSKSGLFGLRDCELYYNLGWDSAPPQGQLRNVVEKVVRHVDGKDVDWAFEQRRYKESWRD